MSSDSQSEVESRPKFENIRKSNRDECQYRGLKLSNEMTVLLISDPSTDKSAASLCVGVGSLNNPKELQGLAHFVEHMLFLGSKKYPTENEHEKFVVEHGGTTNAHTAEEETCYYFDIASGFLFQALDRFAQFFVEPLFTESATEREVKAVNSEFEKNILNDTHRVYQLEKSMSYPDHPFCHLSSGNIETLSTIPKSKGIKIREKLLEFYDTFYSANIMYLAVFGKESLDELESTVSKLFSPVKNKGVKKLVFKDHPYGPAQLKRKFFVVPIKDTLSLKIIFALPDMTQQYKTAPNKYVSHMLGHEGPGSLYSVLRKKELCNLLEVSSSSYISAGFDFCTVTFGLTEKAVDYVDDIISVLFQYIKLLKTDGIKRWKFEELRKLREMNFLFTNKPSPYSYVVTLSSAMQNYPIEDVLSANYLTDEWKPELIEEFLKYLVPENMNVLVIGKAFEDIANQKEYWLGTKYQVEPISENLLEKWKNVQSSPDLFFCSPNDFIPENLNLYPLDKNISEHPYILHESTLSRIWFKQDNDYKLPKLQVRIAIFNPLVKVDPGYLNLITVFERLLSDEMNEYTYAAKLAGLSLDISSTIYGLLVTVNGYNDKLPRLLNEAMRRMLDFKIDSKRFNVIKEKFVRSLKNVKTSQPSSLASLYSADLLTDHAWTMDDLIKTCDALEQRNLEKLLPDIFSRIYIQGLIHGNCNEEKAMEIIKIIESSFKSSVGLLPQQLRQGRAVRLNSGHEIYELPSEIHNNSCLLAYFQCNLESPVKDVLLDLYAQIIREPCYTKLRTQEQLGYLVSSAVRRGNGSQGMQIIIQSEKHPVYLNNRIEEFLKSMRDYVVKMTDEEFNTHKKTLALKKSEKPKTLFEKSEKFWTEIVFRSYNFNKANSEVQHLASLDKNDVLELHDTFFHPGSSRRCKLSVHVLSKVKNPESSEDMPKEGNVITDVIKFKNGLGLYPLPKSYINVRSLGNDSKL